MHKHPYPDYIVDAVSDAVEEYLGYDPEDSSSKGIVSNILRAFWKASMVPTGEELDNLPEYSVIIDSVGCVFELGRVNEWYFTGSSNHYDSSVIALPAVVLWTSEFGV